MNLLKNLNPTTQPTIDFKYQLPLSPKEELIGKVPLFIKKVKIKINHLKKNYL
ncbi:hypothetical protein CPX_001274 [Candidatus Phytoplasma pruni]|uniref:Uncharacterized protein n=1 Tax=Candidatus Phytoplasma pruni TaxID=479893 RepID=A0A0M1N152_9MOLU|nr:hypothetical protein CPX_001274 [Candidatus Phytoplasma pruni]